MSAYVRRRSAPLVGFAALLAALLGAVLTPSAQASPSTSGWLAAQVAGDGSVLDPYSSSPSVDWTVNTALALVTAGDQPEALGRAMTHIRTEAASYVTSGTSDVAGHLSWLILLAVAVGDDPRAFGPGALDLVAQLEDRLGVAEPGLFGTIDEYTPVTNQSLAILALVATGQTPPTEAVDWLLAQQCTAPVEQAGAWQGYRAASGPGMLEDCLPTTSTEFSRPDSASTAFAVLALTAVAATTEPPAERYAAPLVAAFRWFGALQSADTTAPGGFGQFLGDPADPNSTALVITAIAASGVDPGADGPFAAGGADPVSSLRSWVIVSGADAGAVASPYSSGGADLYATYQAMWGLAPSRTPLIGPRVMPVVAPPVDGPVGPVYTG